MGDDEGDERVTKRARVDADPLSDTMGATREQLSRTTDVHLQAKLLLQYSAQAVAPAAATGEAIDFLFSFLQESQAAANGERTKSPPGGDGSVSGGGSGSGNSNGGNNAVVVAAIVRGLRGLLAVKPELVEPMIQLDAMDEQLTQCISVPEDFKLRRDMLRIVLDCLIAARKFTETSQLLSACMTDHDDVLRAICMEGYLRLLSAGYRLDATAARRLTERLRAILLLGDDDRTRALAAQLLGQVAETLYESSSFSTLQLQEVILNTLAVVVRDSSRRVRLQVATAFRGFRASPAPSTLYAHLLLKNQINEDLAEIETQSIAMLSSGALLTLLEDDQIEVATATSTSMRLLCEGGCWSLDVIDRAVSAHIELAARVGSFEEHLGSTLCNLEVFLSQRNAIDKSLYPVTLEELSYMLGSIPATSFTVTCHIFGIMCFLAVDTTHKACRAIQFLVVSSQIKSTETTDPVLVDNFRSSIEQLITAWIKLGLMLPSDTLTNLRGAASRSTVHAINSSCGQIYDAFCRPKDRLAASPGDQRQLIPLPSFLGDS